MAKRKHKQYRVLDSSSIQGEGSFVKIKNLSISEIMQSLGNRDQGNGKLSEQESAELGLRVLDQMVVDWDWVDDDDNPLPIPAENPGTVAALPFPEASWLLQETGIDKMFDTKN